MLSPGVSPPDSDHSFNQSFGEFWWGTRVSTFVPWIESLPTISGAFDLVLDMNQQVFGRDGLIEDLTITARRNGADLELWVDNPAYPAYSGRYYKGPADRITSLTIRGSDDNETIRLEGPLHLGPGAAGAITVWGRHGNDTVIVGDPASGNLADLGGPLEVIGGDGEYDELILNDVANQEATPYIVDSTTLTRRFLPSITYRYFSKLTLNSGSGTDEVELRATGDGTATVIHTSGGNDRVTIGNNSNGLGGLTATVTVDGGGDADDRLLITDRASSDAHDYVLNTSFILRDTQVVEYLHFARVTAEGGSGGNDFDVVATPSATVFLYTGATNDVVRGGSTGSRLDTFLGPLTIDGEGGVDALWLDDSGMGAGQDYTIRTSAVAVANGPTIDYHNVEQLTLDGGFGGNQVWVESTGASLETTVHAGGGDDTVTVGGMAALMAAVWGPLNLYGGLGSANVVRITDRNGSAGDTVDLTAARITFNSRPIDYQQFQGVRIETGTASDLVSARGTCGHAVTTVQTGDGADWVFVASTGSTLDDLPGPLALDGGLSVDQVWISDTGSSAGQTYTVTADQVLRADGVAVRYDDAEVVEFRGGSGGNVFHLRGDQTVAPPTLSEPAGARLTVFAGAGDDTVNVYATRPGWWTQLSGEGGDDTFAVGSSSNLLDGIVERLTLDGGYGDDSAELNDQAQTSPGDYTVLADRVTSSRGATVEVAAVETMTLHGGNGRDLMRVQSTVAATTLLRGHGGDDEFRLGSVGDTLDPLVGLVVTQGDEGSDLTVLNDQGTMAGRAYTVSASQMSWTASVLTLVETRTLNGGAGGNTIQVQGTAAGSSTRVNGGAGSDDVRVASGPPTPNRLDDVQGELTIDGQGGVNNQLTFDDSGSQGPRAYRLTPTRLVRPGGPDVLFSNVARPKLIAARKGAGAGGNSISVTGVAAATEVTVEAGDGDDSVTVGEAGGTLDAIVGSLIVRGESGHDLLRLVETGLSSGDRYTITAETVQVQRLPGLAIHRNGIEAVGLELGSGEDTIALDLPGGGLGLALDGGPGVDTLAVLAGAFSTSTLPLVSLERVQVEGGELAVHSSLVVQSVSVLGGQLLVTTNGAVEMSNDYYQLGGLARIAAGGTLVAGETATVSGGTVELIGGSLTAPALTIGSAGGLTGQGTVAADVATSGTVQVLGNSGDALVISGSFTQTGGTVSGNSGPLQVSGPLTVADGQLTSWWWLDGLTAASYSQTGGVVSACSTLAVAGAVSIAGGTLNLSPWSGSGLSAASYTQTGGTAMVQGGVGLAVSGTFQIDGGTATLRDSSGSIGGQLVVTGGQAQLAGGTITVVGGVQVQAGGLLMIGSGSYQSGRLIGNLSNAGVVRLGAVGSGYGDWYTLTGDYSQTSAGRLVMDVEYYGAADQLAVSGTATLDGVFELQLGNPYRPGYLIWLPVLPVGSRIGEFASLVLPGGANWTPVYDDNGLIGLGLWVE